MIVDAFSIGVPSQIFSATLAVSERVKLGLAQEYALRLTSILGGARLEDFRRFFGLSKDETAQLISWLVRDEFLEHDDGLFVLGTRGEAAFYTDGDELPRIVRPTEVTETIALERVGGSLVPKLVSKVPGYVPTLAEAHIRQYDRNQVAIAIERHFSEWLKTWPKRGTLGFKETLYSVLDVSSERHFTTREQVPLHVDANEGQVQVDLDFTEMHRRGVSGARDALIGVIRNHVATAYYPDDVDVALRFLHKFDGNTLSRFRRMKSFDLQRWIVEGRDDPADTLTFTGSLAVSDARDFIVSTMPQAEAPVAGSAAEARVYAPIIWVRPQHAFWGTAFAYEDFWGKLKFAHRDRGGLLLVSEGQNARGSLSGRAESDLIGEKKFFESAIIAQASGLPRALELVIDPGRWLIAICYGRYGPERLPVGAGMATARPEIISAGTRTVCQALLSALSPTQVRHGEDADYDTIRAYLERLSRKPAPN